MVLHPPYIILCNPTDSWLNQCNSNNGFDCLAHQYDIYFAYLSHVVPVVRYYYNFYFNLKLTRETKELHFNIIHFQKYKKLR